MQLFSAQVTGKPEVVVLHNRVPFVINRQICLGLPQIHHALQYKYNTRQPQIHQEHNKYIPGPHTATTYQSRTPNAPFCGGKCQLRFWGTFSAHCRQGLQFTSYEQFLTQSPAFGQTKDIKIGGIRPQVLPVLDIKQYGFYWGFEVWSRVGWVVGGMVKGSCPRNIYTILWAGLGLVFGP